VTAVGTQYLQRAGPRRGWTCQSHHRYWHIAGSGPGVEGDDFKTCTCDRQAILKPQSCFQPGF
jgi:hypothetical protein